MGEEGKGVQEEIWEEVMSGLSQPSDVENEGWGSITQRGPEAKRLACLGNYVESRLSGIGGEVKFERYRSQTFKLMWVVLCFPKLA